MEHTANDLDLQIEVVPLKKAALIFRAVNHKLRQDLLQLIHRNPGITVTEIYIIMRWEQVVASQQLAILRRAGFLTTKREGKFIHYHVNYESLAKVHKEVQSLLA